MKWNHSLYWGHGDQYFQKFTNKLLYLPWLTWKKRASSTNVYKQYKIWTFMKKMVLSSKVDNGIVLNASVSCWDQLMLPSHGDGHGKNELGSSYGASKRSADATTTLRHHQYKHAREQFGRHGRVFSYNAWPNKNFQWSPHTLHPFLPTTLSHWTTSSHHDPNRQRTHSPAPHPKHDPPFRPLARNVPQPIPLYATRSRRIMWRPPRYMWLYYQYVNSDFIEALL